MATLVKPGLRASLLPFPNEKSPETSIFWILRIAVGMNFLFHGAWGVVGKEAWIPFFAFAGIGPEAADILQRLVGVMDITLGLIALFKPTRAAIVWMIIWCVWTALLRPLTGSAWWYFFERAGNYGPPLALLLYAGWGQSFRAWIFSFSTQTLTENKIEVIKWVLRCGIAAQLISHGMYGVVEGKQLLIGHYASVGLPGSWMDPEMFLIGTGWIEIGLGVLVLLKPVRPALAFIMVWEVFVGLLFPISGLPASEHPQAFLIFRTLERFGDYFAPLGLFVLMTYRPTRKQMKGAPDVPQEPAAVAGD
ncbi:MAG: hypothetical protein ACE5Q6_01420 [Dehalococcoidia bacterium]